MWVKTHNTNEVTSPVEGKLICFILLIYNFWEVGITLNPNKIFFLAFIIWSIRGQNGLPVHNTYGNPSSFVHAFDFVKGEENANYMPEIKNPTYNLKHLAKAQL